MLYGVGGWEFVKSRLVVSRSEHKMADVCVSRDLAQHKLCAHAHYYHSHYSSRLNEKVFHEYSPIQTTEDIITIYYIKTYKTVFG